MMIRTKQNDTVDLLCYNFYGKTAGVTEQVLESNPNLASLGSILPQGIQVYLPELPTQSAIRQTTRLWD